MAAVVSEGQDSQRVVQMVDGLSGGITDSQQSVLSHPATIEKPGSEDSLQRQAANQNITACTDEKGTQSTMYRRMR